MEDFWKKASDTAKETLDIAAEAAEQAAAIAAEKLGELKVTATEKFNELSEKAEALAAIAKAEAAEKFAEAQAAKEKIAAHGGDALDYISEKAKAMVGDVQESANEVAEEGKDFWQKAKDYVSGSEEKKDDTPA
ncbi:MAG: hypothetical protein H7246_10395 [Phycisphaerae bacterium]|nr:hypothetical protein [Saprospiraceae bacterium]